MRKHAVWLSIALAVANSDCVSERAPAWPDPHAVPEAHSAMDLFAKSYALVIGIGKYADSSVPELPTAVSDAVSVEKRLHGQGFDTTLLLDDAATKEKILDRLVTLVSEVSEKDRLLVYFAGHATSIGAAGGELGYLSTYQTEEVLGISMIELNSLLRSARAKQAMLIIDACFSGLAVEDVRSLRKNTSASDYVWTLARERSRTWLVAGTKSQRAYQLRTGGVFTRYLLEGLDGEADLQPKDGWVTGNELSEYVRPRVQEYVKRELNVDQLPQSRHEGNGDYLFQAPGVTSSEPPLPVPPVQASRRWSSPIMGDDEPGKSRFGVVPWVLLGTGAAAFGTGILFGLLTLHEQSRLEKACPSFDCADPGYARTQKRGERFARTTDVLWAGGVVSAGVGVTLWLIDNDAGSRSSAGLALDVRAGCFRPGCGLAAHGQF